MKRSLSLILLALSIPLLGQIKSPSEFLGYEIGTQFSRHADVVKYFEYVAQKSNMVTYQDYGVTYERRPLTYAIVSTPENISNIEKIRTDNLKNIGLLEGTAQPDKAIVWLSYNVHGNEASSTEASMLTLFMLVTQKQNWLENTVVIIDPCINPDGRDRYANWYNQVKATPYNVAQDATEHYEPWPGGRPNHYLFDLNRDWSWATQVESSYRLEIYNRWMPHVHVDFHEQGINEPYYFAPAAEPYHEIISPWQRQFQIDIGKNHARYFDKEGWLFFTRERFDLLYPGYGDTYPTFVGAIGMTYEQAGHGRAGLGINTDEGYVLTLIDRVAHHTTTGLSTIEISSANALKLNTEFKKFFNNGNLKYKSYALKGEKDKIEAIRQLLDKHEIEYGFSNGGLATGLIYSTHKKGSMDLSGALIINTDQPKGKLVKALLEPDAVLTDPLTYDSTAWSIPYAYGLEALASTSPIQSINAEADPMDKNIIMPTCAGYISKWNSVKDAKFLSDLMQHDVKVRFSEMPLSFNGNSFERGSLVITRSDNKEIPKFDELVNKIADLNKRSLYASMTSFSDNGTDFGSSDVKLINKQNIAVLKGEGVSSLNYGSIWHFFEQQMHYPITSIDLDYFDEITLEKYDVLILPSGWGYENKLKDSALDQLKEWVKSGGKIIVLAGATSFFKDKEDFGLKSNNKDDENEENKDLNEKNDNLLPYDQRERDRLKNFISGSIYKVSIDNTHPMAFGYDKEYFSFKMSNRSFEFLESGFNVGYIKDSPISMAGFSGEDAKNNLSNSLVFGEVRMGKGSIIYIVDDIMYRSFWENGKLFLVNSIFFVNNNRYRIYR
jgi:uncharacterized membrane protein